MTISAGPYYADESVTLHHGDCLEVLRGLPENSVDAVCTDPPYSLGFMSRQWDIHDTPLAFQRWCQAWAAECLRVLKPGGFMLSFGGTRTWHRLVVAVEDAGFEIRDCVVWLYGQGFAKGRDFPRLDYAAQGRHDLAAKWAGWNVALKPAWEPIVVARKPLGKGTVAANVLAHGTGGLNIDGCRVGMSGGGGNGLGSHFDRLGDTDPLVKFGEDKTGTVGRWPANVLLDGDAAAELDATGPHTKDGVAVNRNRPEEGSTYDASSYMIRDRRRDDVTYGGEGGPSRFFPTFRYQAKAPARERPKVNGVAHPTCKPLGLVRWLVRLVCPPGGVVLDLFAGSGTTVEAAIIEGFRCVAVERGAEYLPLILARMERGRAAVKARSVTEALPPTAGQLNLFAEPTA